MVESPDADLGELPIAFVILKHGERLDEPALKAFVKGSLARIYVPAEIRDIDVLPTNSVGKTDRKALRTVLAVAPHR